MIELTHTIVGAAIAAKIENPALSLPLALASHFVLDLLPHWNPHLNRELKEQGKISKRTTIIVAFDTILSLIAGFTIASQVLPNITHFIAVIAASFFAVLPDVIEGPYFFLKSKSNFLIRFVKFQTSLQLDVPVIPGLITQVIVIAAAVWWIMV
ncbi:MAG: hypothetical protein HYU80_03605 [Candidatus Blackburnbacteria bacterium]|nr:hypothetical protein [Candidatus Blackburnbacteria bacterium]